jgi:hypothetical protein
MNYKNKYLKYKQKYLNLKNQYGGMPSAEEVHDLSTYLEFYEFVLSGYPQQMDHRPIRPGIDNTNFNYKTASLDSSDSKECGIIKVIDTPEQQEKRTCDPIKGQILRGKIDNFDMILTEPNGIRFKFNLRINIDHITYNINSDDLIQFISSYGGKIKNRPIIQIEQFKFGFIYDETIVTQILDLVVPLYTMNWEPPYTNEDDDMSMILYINKPDIEYLIFGDFHGSLSTFIRHLLRLRSYNIIDDNGILDPKYNLIYLGDIIDRGKFGYEIIIILYILKILNPQSIFLNRGNHEEMKINKRYGFKDELKIQFGVDNIIYTKINNIMKYYHSALIIKNPSTNKYIYLSHGGLPTLLNPLYIIKKPTNSDSESESDSDSESESDEDMIDESIVTNILSKDISIILDPIIEEIIKCTQRTTFISKTFYTNNNITIRWNDFNSKYSSNTNIRELYGTQIHTIGPKILRDAYDLGIELIIRGHQDSFANSTLLVNGLDTDDGLFDINQIDKTNDFDNYRIRTTNDFYIQIIDKNNNQNESTGIKQFLPVVTISTNTDIYRPFYKDSFARLMFNRNKPSLEYSKLMPKLMPKFGTVHRTPVGAPYNDHYI